MVETLKNCIDCYKNNLVDTPNLQIIEKQFSNEMITFPDNIIDDFTLYSSTFRNSRLTNIKLTNGNFGSSFFKECLLENCVFDSTNLQSSEWKKCTLKNCVLINCDLSDSNFTETIFDECQFQGFEEGALGESLFKSCHFIKTIFNGFSAARIGSAGLINSKFSNSMKSIEFQGNFYFIDLLQPDNGITGMLLE